MRAMSGRRKLTLALLAVVFFATIYVVRIRGDMVDFGVNYRAGGRLLQGEPLYRESDGHFMFKYFPISALAYAPLSVLPLEIAKVFWFALGATCTVAMFVLARRLVARGAARHWAVLVVPAAVLAKFCLRELKLGQINTVVTLIVLAMVWLLVDGKRKSRFSDFGAGALWGLATLLKPYGMIFLPYFVVTRNVKALLGGAGLFGLGFCVPWLLYGWRGNLELHREWYRSLSASTPAQLGVADNVSLVGAFTKWTGDASLAFTLASAGVAVAAVAVLAVVRKGRGLDRSVVLECGLLLTLIPMISPLGWDYQFLTSVLAVSLLVEHFSDLSFRWLLAANFAIIALSVYDVMGRSAYRAFMDSSALTVCFVVVVGYLCASRWRRIA